MSLNAQSLIQTLSLEPHPIEGGYFKRSYCAEGHCYDEKEQQRALMSSIYYLLSLQSPIGYLHRNQSDIIHYFHSGNPIRYWLVDEKQQLQSIVLGNDILAGQQPQLLVTGNVWKASELLVGDYDYGLISEAVTPAFEYHDNELARPDSLQSYPVSIQKVIRRFVK